MIIGITGTEGLIDWHLRSYLKTIPYVHIKMASRDTFLSDESMRSFVQDCEAIVHLAGMNRGDEHVLYETNLALTKKLIIACEEVGVKPHVIFSSSTHIERETVYGRSKRDCAAMLGDWAARVGAIFTEMVLPHVFGEGGKPFYNSVVSTFCYQIAHGESPVVDGGGELEPIHAQEVARLVLEIIRDRKKGRIRIQGHPLSVQALFERISEFGKEYSAQILPDLRDPFDLALFNTYRSYLFPQTYPVALVRHTDDRGGLVETVKSRQGGQAFISDTRSGITRGNHFHLRKVERFLVISGEGTILLRRLFSDEVITFNVTGDNPSYIDIPTMYTHNITNVGSRMMTTLFWSNEIFDAANPDTYPEPVIL